MNFEEVVITYTKIWEHIRVRQELEARALELSRVYQRNEKIAAAKHNGVSAETYFHLPFDGWEKIQTEYLKATRNR